jgi:cell division control protein 6
MEEKSLFAKSRVKIYKDRSVFLPTYLPLKLVRREEQIHEIADQLGFVLSGSTPPSLLIIGPSGSGKTASTLFVLRELNKTAPNVIIGYTKVLDTVYTTATALAINCGLSLPLRGLTFSVIYQKLVEYIGNRFAILCIDEIDKLLRLKNGIEVLYHVSRTPNICVIGITNKLDFIYKIDDIRVRSSYRPRKIVFPPYNATDMKEILMDRVKIGMENGVIDNSAIEYIAGLSAQRGGDARYALDLTLLTGDMAEKEQISKITDQLVMKAKNEFEQLFIEHSLQHLPIQQKIILYVVAKNRQITPRDLHTEYNVLSKRLLKDTLSPKRISDHLKELEFYGYIVIEGKGRGRGKGVEWRISLNPTYSADLLFSAFKKEEVMSGLDESNSSALRW